MSILERLLQPRAELITHSSDLDKLLRNGGSDVAGVTMNADSAMRVAAVYACVRVLAEGVAQVPVQLFERDPSDARVRRQRDDHPAARLVANPNSLQTGFEFREMMQAHLALQGNAYAFKNRAGGRVRELLPIPTSRISPRQVAEWEVRYDITFAGGDRQTFTSDEILHLRALSSNGLWGMSPVAMHRQTFAISKATETQAAKMFGNGIQQSGALKHPKSLSDNARQHLKQSLERNYAGVENAFRVLLLEEGLEWQAIQMSAVDAQYLESRKFTVSDIARIFRIAPHMIGDLEKATFSNIDAQQINHLVYTMDPWFTRWEERLALELLTPVERRSLFFEFDPDKLLRGDPKARHETYKAGVLSGYYTRNEVRKWETLNPLDGLDEPLQPANMLTTDEGDPAPDPSPDPEPPPAEN